MSTYRHDIIYIKLHRQTFLSCLSLLRILLHCLQQIDTYRFCHNLQSGIYSDKNHSIALSVKTASKYVSVTSASLVACTMTLTSFPLFDCVTLIDACSYGRLSISFVAFIMIFMHASDMASFCISCFMTGLPLNCRTRFTILLYASLIQAFFRLQQYKQGLSDR